MNEVQLRKVAKRRVAFKKHLFAFLAVIAFLVVVNLMTSPESLWFTWVALGWGLGIVLHGIFTFIDGRETMESREFEKLKRSHTAP